MPAMNQRTVQHLKFRFGSAKRWHSCQQTTAIADAQTEGFVAPQLKDPLSELLGTSLPTPHSEDCLNLNIFIPQNAHNLPVMLWIHGGGFVIGSGEMDAYNGATLAEEQRVIVVTINYRLGALGFLRLCDISDGAINTTGNEGLGDQICALKWIKDNISTYGGNSENVTIFGESAGAMSVATLLASPLCKGLFSKAILQSGAGHSYQSIEQANQVARAFLKHAENNGMSLEQLQSASCDDILEVQAAFQSDPKTIASFGILSFKPVIDGHLLTMPPLEAIAQGAANNIAIISGYNRDEWTLFAQLFQQSTPSEKALRDALSKYFKDELIDDAIADARSRLRSYGETQTPQKLLDTCLSEYWFGEPSRRLRDAHVQAGGDHWYYRLDYTCPSDELRASHCIDLGFVFGNTNALFHGSAERSAKLEQVIPAHWGHFAHHGTPLSHWAPSHQSTMLFGEDEQPSLCDTTRSFWSSISNQQLAEF